MSDNIKHFIQEYKTSIGQKPSVWKVFGRVYKDLIIYAGLARVVYDLGCLVGPVVLNGIIVYVMNYGKTSVRVTVRTRLFRKISFIYFSHRDFDTKSHTNIEHH